MRTVLIVLFDGVQSLDVTGPLEVLSTANRLRTDHHPAPGYAITTASLGAGNTNPGGPRLAYAAEGDRALQLEVFINGNPTNLIGSCRDPASRDYYFGGNLCGAF